MFSDTDVAPEATVEPALRTVQFVSAAVGICVGGCLRLTAQNSDTEISKFIYQLIANIQVYCTGCPG
jgi:hypothetical protein